MATKKDINGNIGMLFSAENTTSAEKSFFHLTRTQLLTLEVAKQLDPKLDTVAVDSVSCKVKLFLLLFRQNRRHSSMILKLSRARSNDTSLRADDE
eukprot:8580583-Karenia_brevis.AAC.1